MDNKDVAQELRSKGAALAKAKTEGYRGMYFGSCTTLATRLRCEVMIITLSEIKMRDLVELCLHFRF
jgi:hypothetical protein